MRSTPSASCAALEREPTLFRQRIDQPVVNDLHAVADNTLVDTETLAPFFRWASRDGEPAHDEDGRRGAVHFSAGRRLERLRA